MTSRKGIDLSKTIILPACDDGNRGDQALVWQTYAIAKEAGLADDCKMLTDLLEDSPQSQAVGIGLLQPILRHPSAKFSPHSNLSYGKLLLVIWGLISIFDGFKSFLLLFRPTRFVLYRFLSESEKRTIDEIKSADACFVKGGGFIHTTDSITDPYKAYYFLYHVLLAQSFGTPVFVMPNSFGPFKGALFQAIVRRALSRCELVTVRESISQDMLAAIGIKSDLYPDLAFGLESETADHALFEGLRREYPQRPIVGITARPYRFPGSENPAESYRKYLIEFADFARDLFQQGYLPVFIEHVVSTGKHESDISAIESITEQLNSNEFAVFSDPTLTARQLKSIYGECDFVVGTRFHSVIFSLSEGTPALAVGYGGNKGRGIMKDIGLPDNVISIENFTAVEGKTKFERLVNQSNSKEFLKALNAKIETQHMKLRRTVEQRF